jgi:hypothetical protein
MSSNNNTYELNHLSDNWGFYVDIENLNPPLEENKEKCKINKYKNYNKKINHCETINEEREYYCKEENYIEEKDESNMIVNISSTIFITAVITYLILFYL